MKKKIILLGAGLVGSAIAIDLSKNHSVTAADIDPSRLNKLKDSKIKKKVIDLNNPQNISSLVTDFDIVINALPGFMGFKTLETVIKAGKDVVDISFMPEDYMSLDNPAKTHNVTAIVDCGIAPGLGNIILGHQNQCMKIESFTCYVGGLPFIREWPWEYKAVFSPIDVIEEYTRPARYIKNGKLLTSKALSGIEYINFENIGTLEAWNSDGLRSLISTMNIPNMIEKTLRYPGTTKYIEMLRESGFFSTNEVDINGTTIKPINLTAKLLFPKWELKPGDRDFTIMKIIIKGEEKNKSIVYEHYLFDEYDKQTNTLSMARTTGYTCNAAVNLLINNQYNQKGISPPEYIGRDEKCFLDVMKYLEERNIRFIISRKRI